jgi:hypothetical protein
MLIFLLGMVVGKSNGSQVSIITRSNYINK